MSDEVLPQLYRSALALVYIPFAEGFGLPIIEAMRHGVPVLASCAPGVTEAVGSAGLAVDPTSERDIADAMLRIAIDSSLRDELRARGRHWSAGFSWQGAAERVLAACRSAHESRQTRQGIFRQEV